VDKLLFVYRDWTLEEVPRCFYVGKGDEKRIRKRDRNEYWKRVADKYGWRREKILSTKDPMFVGDQEVEWIVKMNTYHYDRSDGWGCNFTRGRDVGGAHLGHPHSEATKEVLRQKSLGNKNCVGRKYSAETLAKKSGVNHHYFGKRLTAEHIEKNRIANHGENNAQAKLTWDIVRQIRMRYATGDDTHASLAIEFKVSSTLIGYIIRGKLWKEKDDQIC
jgi:hypothetical protein